MKRIVISVIIGISGLATLSPVHAATCKDYERTTENEHKYLYPDVVYDEVKSQIPLKYRNDEYRKQYAMKDWEEHSNRSLYNYSVKESASSRPMDYYLVPYPPNTKHKDKLFLEINRSATLTSLIKGINQGKYEKRYSCTKLFITWQPNYHRGLSYQCYNYKTKTPTTVENGYRDEATWRVVDNINGRTVSLFTRDPMITRTTYRCTKDNKMVVDTYDLIQATAWDATPDKYATEGEQYLPYLVVRHRRGTISNPQNQLEPAKKVKITL